MLPHWSLLWVAPCSREQSTTHVDPRSTWRGLSAASGRRVHKKAKQLNFSNLRQMYSSQFDLYSAWNNVQAGQKAGIHLSGPTLEVSTTPVNAGTSSWSGSNSMSHPRWWFVVTGDRISHSVVDLYSLTPLLGIYSEDVGLSLAPSHSYTFVL